jgi:hypothetical protein
MPNWMAKIAGWFASKEIKLEDGKMDSTKSWFKSKGVWTAVVTIVIGLYSLVSATLMPAIGHAPLPAIPEWVFTFLGALGLYSRVTATKTIG